MSSHVFENVSAKAEYIYGGVWDDVTFMLRGRYGLGSKFRFGNRLRFV